MIKIIIFDFDRTIGTLVVEWDDWRQDIKKLIQVFDPDTNIELLDIRHTKQNDLIQKYGTEFREQLNQINQQFELTRVTDFTINKPVLDFIKSTDKELYCWSSNSRKTLEKYLGEMGIISRFEKIVSRDETYLMKPDNEGFGFIYDPEVSKEEYLFVGDSEADKVVAEKSGITFMHVAYFSKVLTLPHTAGNTI